jgi:hypothetical protein
MRTLYAFVIMAVLAACASVQPAAIQAGDRCLRCRQPVSDLRVAAEAIDRMRAPFAFRSPACLAKYVKATPPEQITAVFVTDFRSGRMLNAGDAWFVPAKLPGADGRRLEQDYLAFKSRTDAEAARSGQPLLRWAQVVAEATN